LYGGGSGYLVEFDLLLSAGRQALNHHKTIQPYLIPFCMQILALFLPRVIKSGCWPVIRFIRKNQIPKKMNIGISQENKLAKNRDSNFILSRIF